MVTSSGQDRLKEYRQQLIKELEDTDLSSDRKADYRKQIETETNPQKLEEIENNFHNESRIDHDQAVDQASTSLSMYMTNLLNELDSSASGFEGVLKQAMEIVKEYQRKFGEDHNRKEIEQLQQEGQTKLDKLVEDFKNSLSNQQSKPSGNSNSSNGRGDTTKPANQGLDSDSPSGKEHNNPTPPKVENQGGNIVSTEKTTETNLKEAKETAKTTLDNYMLTRLKQENGGVFWFTDLLRESKESVEKYKRMFDEASSKEKVENLVKEAEQEIEALVVKHKGREISLERDKAKAAVTKHLTGLLDDIKKNLEKDHHINTVELIKNLKDIEKTYLHKLDESTQKAQLKKLVAESQSKLDEALSNFKKGLSSSSNSGSSTKPETPEKPEVKPTPETPEVKPVPQPAPPKTSKIFTASNGNTKITVMFETATEADSVNLKEVTTKEMIDNVTRQTGQGTVRIFDISLSKDGQETHVNGERVVRLAIGNIDSEIQVYHVKENGELELLPSTVENGQVVFKTSHFSLFAIKTLPKKQMATEPEANREGKTQSDDKEMVLLADKANQMSENRSNSDKKDKQALPSTGTMSTLFMEFLGLISLVGVYLLKGKKTEND
ncbi:LPXTG cell wall anchor domain-containing protein [Streptococcus pneumoniae]|uniref:LPXTG cell wall anchor domain-containing protein n=1 Tax=Streptococcus pneumoniae TaxID=1313 RepID=UPI0005DC942E|nr:LPXTG cell wall anchor domain-containing protein [Streptococcus pneumoniae]COR78507.1 surface protein PspC [Streptococcus pneumoniae]